MPVVVSPAPRTHTASVDTQISFLGTDANTVSLQSISVVGSKSGHHRGRVIDYSGAKGASFIPNRPFLPSETVTVTTDLPIVGATGQTFHFAIGDAVTSGSPVHHHYRLNAPGVRHFASVASIAPPSVQMRAPASTFGEGDIFLSPKGSKGQPGVMILSPEGHLIWFHRLANPNAYAMNFSVQRYDGQSVLTWWQGQIVDGHGQGEDIIMNSSYQTLAVIHGGNGFAPDLHDLQISGDTAWVTSYQTLHWNLSSINGPKSGLVWDGIVQEIDIKTGLVMFEWHSLDHVPVSRSYFHSSPHATSRIDYFHVNSIDVLSPSQILVSSRNTSAAYDISIADGGSILWQIGGKASSFHLGKGVRFNLQHDVRLSGNDQLTVFDNNATPVYGQSKALVIHLDFQTRSASLVTSIEHRPHLIAAALGNVQTLASGNLFVGWGTTPYFDEYSSTGALIFEGKILKGDNSYRAFRSPWTATPTTRPDLVVQRAANGTVTLSASWNGATEISSWKIFNGTVPSSLAELTTAQSVGFETPALLTNSSLGRYFEVQALNSAGKVIGTSSVVTLSS